MHYTLNPDYTGGHLFVEDTASQALRRAAHWLEVEGIDYIDGVSTSYLAEEDKFEVIVFYSK